MVIQGRSIRLNFTYLNYYGPHSIEHRTATNVFLFPLHQSHVNGSQAQVLTNFGPWTWPANEKVRDWLEQGWARWEEEKPEW